MHCMYVVKCVDGTLYTGYSPDVEARVAAHNAGKGAKYTRGRGPLQIVYRERCLDHGTALRREYAVKQLTREEKERLILEYKP